MSLFTLDCEVVNTEAPSFEAKCLFCKNRQRKINGLTVPLHECLTPEVRESVASLLLLQSKNAEHKMVMDGDRFFYYNPYQNGFF